MTNGLNAGNSGLAASGNERYKSKKKEQKKKEKEKKEAPFPAIIELPPFQWFGGKLKLRGTESSLEIKVKSSSYYY